MMWTIGLALAAASPDPAAVAQLRALQEQDQRVATIAFRLATSNASICKKRRGWSGFVIHEPGQYAPAVRQAAEAAFGFEGRPTVLAVVANSPAARAGLKPDERITAINGKPVTASSSSKASYDGITAIKDLLAAETDKGAIQLETVAGVRIISAQQGCYSDVEIVPGRKLNADADGEMAQISSAIIGEAQDDDELAFVIAHEIAHNILEHPQQLAIGRRSASRVRATEIEADRMAVSLMKRAGFDPTAAARFWAHFGAKTSYGIFSDGTHLRTKKRVALLKGAAASLENEPSSAQSDGVTKHGH